MKYTNRFMSAVVGALAICAAQPAFEPRIHTVQLENGLRVVLAPDQVDAFVDDAEPADGIEERADEVDDVRFDPVHAV